MKVALLVPLTGRGADVGQSMLRAAEMALFEVADDRLVLVPRDTQGTSAGAATAAREAIRAGAQLILGPLFGPNTAAVRAVAQPAGVSVITFSTDRRLAAPNLYVLGFTPDEQVQRVADYAIGRGLRRIALLAPQDAYGDTVAAALAASLRGRGAELARTERYQPGSSGAAQAAQRLGAPSGTFDALLIAEGPNLPIIADRLSPAGTDRLSARLLGTGLWDDPAVGRIAPLLGGWFAGPEPQMRESFVARYATIHGQPPASFISALAYDAVALAAVLAGRSQGTAPISQSALTDPDGFAGVTGVFRLLPTGIVERALAVLEVTPAGPRVIDPAPLSFPDKVAGFGS